MRKKTVFQILLLAVSLITVSTACSDEQVVNPIQPTNGGEGTLTFTLPGLKKGAVSYADPIADGKENDLEDLTIYMFYDSGTLEKIYRMENITLGGSAAKRTAKIDVTGKSGKKTFYFVGNGQGRSEDLEDLTAGTTLESDFIEAITNQHTDTLSTPLLMSGKTSITDVTTPGTYPLELEVKLARRVVRLDIDNNPDSTNFDVKKVLVSKAKLRGYVFNDATDTPAKDKGEATYAPIVLNKNNEATPSRLDSVFYLYPTTLGAGKTEISLEGTFNGETKVYNFKTADVNLTANKRYVLKVKKVDVVKAEMELVISEWEDEPIDPANPETDLVTFSAIDHSGVPGIKAEANDTYDLTGVTAAGKLKFTVSSFDAQGTTATMKYNYGDENTYSELKINAPQPTLTYSASYEQAYEINIPKIADTKKPLEMVITIQNEVNVDQRKVITLYVNRYADTKLYPVKVGDLYWAPVSVGATEIGSSQALKHTGYYYQWGRDHIGFVYNGETGNPTDVYETAGVVDITKATTGDAKDKFIKGVSGATDYDWLSPPQNDLWSGAKAQGPCPDGWRVPTKADFEKLVTVYNGGYDKNSGKVTWDATNTRVAIKGDNNTDILYLPASGNRNIGNGASLNYGKIGRYWSSGPDDLRAMGLDFHSTSLSVSRHGRAAGFPVRCVQDLPTTP